VGLEPLYNVAGWAPCGALPLSLVNLELSSYLSSSGLQAGVVDERAIISATRANKKPKQKCLGFGIANVTEVSG
jgi:hypothetical protein